jgi:hypothetical protein
MQAGGAIDRRAASNIAVFEAAASMRVRRLLLAGFFMTHSSGFQFLR